MVQRRSAYTLFELVLVLALVVIVTAVIYPSLDAMYGDYRLTQATDMVRAGWAQARAHALDEGRAYRFAVVPGKGNYRIAPDSADFWSGAGDFAPSTDPANPPLLSEEALPRGVRFILTEADALDQGGDTVLPPGTVDPALWSAAAMFLPDGTARDDVEITFHSRGAQPVVLRLRALTGVVTLTRLPIEGY